MMQNIVAICLLNSTVTPTVGLLGHVASPRLTDGYVSFSGGALCSQVNGIFRARLQPDGGDGGDAHALQCAAHSGMPMPGASGAGKAVYGLGAASGGATLAFSAADASGAESLLLWDGAKARAALAGGSAAARGLTLVRSAYASSVDGSSGVFASVNSSTGRSGIWTWPGLQLVVDNHTAVPTTDAGRKGGLFKSLFPFAASGGTTVFFGSNDVAVTKKNSAHGVFVAQGGAAAAAKASIVVENEGASVPGWTGKSSFFGFGGVAIVGSTVSFFATGGDGTQPATVGIYACEVDAESGRCGKLDRIADTRDSIPPCGGSASGSGGGAKSAQEEAAPLFQYVQQQTCTKDACVFLGNDNTGNRGIYHVERSSKKLRCLVDRTTLFQGSALTYLEMAQPAFDGTRLAFYAVAADAAAGGPEGIFAMPSVAAAAKAARAPTRRRRSLKTDDLQVASVPHVRQSYSWDCGLACILMVLRIGGLMVTLDDLMVICGTRSVWTVDLAYLLHHFRFEFEFTTLTLGVKPEYSAEDFYKHDIDVDARRVNRLFEGAVSHGITVRESALTIAEITSQVGRGCMFIVLIDKRYLPCTTCGNMLKRMVQQRTSAGFVGHYVLVYAFNPARQLLHIKDPAASANQCTVKVKDFENARKAFGTDEDLLRVVIK